MLDKTGHTCKQCQEAYPVVNFTTQTRIVAGKEYTYLRKLCNVCKFKQYKQNKQKKEGKLTLPPIQERIRNYFEGKA